MSATGQVTDKYDSAFFTEQIRGSIRSASVVVPLVLKLFPGATSVLDVGCGAGEWLSMFSRHGVAEITGIDGHYAGDTLLQIPRDCFCEIDLNEPFHLGRRFDLAISLEVAERLSPQRGPGLVVDLCDAADVIIFSAAIPGQGDTMHIHEQWQSYWARLFERHGYKPFDVLRPKLWSDTRVEWWYAQNILCFVNQRRIADFPALSDSEKAPNYCLNLVHPGNFRRRVESDEALRREVAVLRSENERLSAQARYKSNYEALTRSTSWYLTAPMRAVGRRSKALRKFGRIGRAGAAHIWRRHIRRVLVSA